MRFVCWIFLCAGIVRLVVNAHTEWRGVPPRGAFLEGKAVWVVTDADRENFRNKMKARWFRDIGLIAVGWIGLRTIRRYDRLDLDEILEESPELLDEPDPRLNDSNSENYK